MKQVTFSIILLLIMTVMTGNISSAQNIKIGFVNSAKILQEYPDAQEANKKLDEMGKRWQSELEKMSRDDSIEGRVRINNLT